MPIGTGLVPKRPANIRPVPGASGALKATRRTSARDGVSKTATSLEPALETSAYRPSGVTFTRIGNDFERRVAWIARVAVSRTLTVSAARLATNTRDLIAVMLR